MKKPPVPNDKTTGRGAEVTALVAAARAVLENRAFADAARAIFEACKAILGADAGFVAVSSAGGNAEVAYLDPGRLGLTVADGLPAPIRSLSERASQIGQPVVENVFPAGAWTEVLPAGCAAPENVLLVPLVIPGKVDGLLVLANKPGGFSDADSRLAVVFAELAAAALVHKRDADLLEKSRHLLEREVRERTTQLQQAQEAAQRAWHTVTVLREATLELTRNLDRDTVLTTLLDHLRRLVSFDRARVMVLEEPSRVSVRAIFDGDRIVRLPPGERPEFEAVDDPLVDGILKTGTAVLVPDTQVHPEWGLRTEASGEASWMGVPLFARGDVAGLFALAKREAGYFNEEHVRLAEALSAQASVAVENAILFEKMQAATARMKTLSRRLLEVHESERSTIARELHDEAGQALVSLRFGLRLLEREKGVTGRIKARVAELKQTTDAVLESLHRLAADLRPASLDHLGLEAALRQYVRSTGAKFGLAARFKARGLRGERLPMAVESALFRVVQEAVTNVVRHASANRVDVLAERCDDRVMVMVEDDGAGFDLAEAEHGGRLGLVGMRERAEALGGTLTLETAPGKGTTVVVEVGGADPHPDN